MYYMSYCYPNLIDTDTHTDTDTTILIPETGIGTGLILILMPGILLYNVPSIGISNDITDINTRLRFILILITILG